MPAKPRWLLHIPDILDQLRDLSIPVVDRSIIERLFRVRRRRAIDLMGRFGGYRSGNLVLVDRLEMIAALEDLWESPATIRERKRKARLAERLEALHRYRRAATVVIPPTPPTTAPAPSLPQGTSLDSGRLIVEFSKPEELLQRLYAVAQTAAQDYDAFQATLEHHLHDPR